MTFDGIMQQSGIPLLVFAVSLYYAWRVYFLKDYESVRGKDKPPVKDRDGYCKAVGRMLLFFSIATLVMAVLLLFNEMLGVIEIIVSTLAMFIVWKKVNDSFPS